MSETDPITKTIDGPTVEELTTSVEKLEGTLTAKKGTIRDLKGKLTALEALGDPAEATKAIEFFAKHKDDPESTEKFKTLAEQKIKEAADAHAIELAKRDATILTLTKGHDGAEALAASGGVKEGYADLLEDFIAKNTAVREIGGKSLTVVLDTDGEPLTAPGSLTPLPLATWVKETVKTQFPDMFLGQNAGGGGGHKTTDGKSDGSGGEVTREEWDGMEPQAQTKHVAEGGKVA